LRCIAAFMVVVHHIEQLKDSFGLASYWNIPVFGHMGHLGVVLFFVLSGFLITYLLLKEITVDKKIDIGKFYIRRVLRIWPLYYLLIILSYWIYLNVAVFSHPQPLAYGPVNLLLSLTIFPNLALAFGGAIPPFLWSIGVEEQFYILWPLIIRYFKGMRGIMIFVVLYLAIKCLVSILNPTIPHGGDTLSRLFKVFSIYWIYSPFSCMAIGGAFGVLCYDKNNPLYSTLRTFIFSKPIEIIAVISAITLIAIGFGLPNYWDSEIYAVLFAIIIANAATNENTIIKLEGIKPLSYLGKISYGIYMYHSGMITFTLHLLTKTDATSNYLIYPISIAATVLLASVSYYFFETPFIKKKIRFSTIVSGDNARH
jgi:peptidoglycan/LPS O-acetylase OafA/YrhL